MTIGRVGIDNRKRGGLTKERREIENRKGGGELTTGRGGIDNRKGGIDDRKGGNC